MNSNSTIAAMFGATPEQVRRQRARNAAQLREMEAKARTAGRKVNGYTADRLAALAEQAESSA